MREMADLNYGEKAAIEKLFGMSSGYVLDFSNRTFQEFVLDSVGIDIFNTKYAQASGSKAHRLRSFLATESNAIAGKLLSDLLELMGDAKEGEQANAFRKCEATVARLLAPPVADPPSEFDAMRVTADDKPRSPRKVLASVVQLANDIEAGAAIESLSELARRLSLDVAAIDFDSRFESKQIAVGHTRYTKRMPITDEEIRRDGLINGLWRQLNAISEKRFATASPDQLRKLVEALGQTIRSPDKTPVARKPFRDVHFKVAVSFPGEYREYVSQVVDTLFESLGPDTIFYDIHYQADLARPNLDLLLQETYRNRSDLVVVFLCAEYQAKQWCGLEWRAIRDIIKSRSDESIMFVRFDDAPVDGTLSIDGYIDARAHPPEVVARYILQRVGAA